MENSKPRSSPASCRYCHGTGFIDMLQGEGSGPPRTVRKRCDHKRQSRERMQ